MANIREGRPAPDRPEERCPFCRAAVAAQDEVCPACGEELFEEPRPRGQRPPQDTGLELLVPVNVSGWAVAAGYLGLFSCFPLVGLLVAVPAIVCSIMALRSTEKSSTMGKFSGTMRAVVGLGLGVLGLLVWSIMLAALLFDKR